MPSCWTIGTSLLHTTQPSPDLLSSKSYDRRFQSVFHYWVSLSTFVNLMKCVLKIRRALSLIMGKKDFSLLTRTSGLICRFGIVVCVQAENSLYFSPDQLLGLVDPGPATAMSLCKHIPPPLYWRELCVFVTLVLCKLCFPGRIKASFGNCLFLKTIIVKQFAKMLSQSSASQQPVRWTEWALSHNSTYQEPMPREDRGKGQKYSQNSSLCTNGSQRWHQDQIPGSHFWEVRHKSGNLHIHREFPSDTSAQTVLNPSEAILSRRVSRGNVDIAWYFLQSSPQSTEWIFNGADLGRVE